jgi:hypothetical protein
MLKRASDGFSKHCLTVPPKKRASVAISACVEGQEGERRLPPRWLFAVARITPERTRTAPWAMLKGELAAVSAARANMDSCFFILQG